MTAAVKLGSISWDFANAKTGWGPHSIHPYPAKFIPQIPRTLIDLFHPGDGSIVLDPFCGSGTTLVETIRAGLPGTGVDLHPLATLITKVKTTPLCDSLGIVARDVVTAARQLLEKGGVEIPPIPRVDHWFLPQIKIALSALVTAIKNTRNKDTSDALKIALSSIIVRVSNQESDTRYAAIGKNITQDEVFHGFERAASSIASALEYIGPGLFRGLPHVRVINKDLMMATPEDIGSEVGLVVTSPPYPNAYEYWLYHKYRMYWLGMDPIRVRTAEIGARPHYFKKNHQTEVDFERQMGRCFLLLARVMQRKAYACFIVGRSIIHGRTIDNEALLVRAAEPHGFHKAASVERKIALTRKSFNLAHGTINREKIVAFVFENQ